MVQEKALVEESLSYFLEEEEKEKKELRTALKLSDEVTTYMYAINATRTVYMYVKSKHANEQVYTVSMHPHVIL